MMRFGLKPKAEERAAQIDKICTRLLMGLPLLGAASWLFSQALHFHVVMHPLLAWPTFIAALVAAFALFFSGLFPITIAAVAADPTEQGTIGNKLMGVLFSVVFTFAFFGLFVAQLQSEANALSAAQTSVVR